MSANTIFTWIWVALAVIFTTVEVTSAFIGRTLSWEVWYWVTGIWPDSPIPRWLRLVNRVFIGLLLAWLFVHFDFGWL